MRPVIETILARTYQAPSNPALVREVLVSLAGYAGYLEEEVMHLSSALSLSSSSLRVEGTMQAGASPGGQSSSAASTQGEGSSRMQSEVPSSSGGGGSQAAQDDEDGEEGVDENLAGLTEGMAMGGVTIFGSRARFYGPSSNTSFVKAALDVGGSPAPSVEENSKESAAAAVATARVEIARFKRPFYWTVHKVSHLLLRVSFLSFVHPAHDCLLCIIVGCPTAKTRPALPLPGPIPPQPPDPNLLSTH
jgi:hypothetical protein